MTKAHEWLPPLMPLAASGGDWDRYLDELYGIFKKDFIDSEPSFRGKQFKLRRYPLVQNREITFWHCISEGEGLESDRMPDMRRCERLCWIGPIIKNCEKHADIKIWENKRKSKKRVCIWLEVHEFLVILDSRPNYYMLLTAYNVIDNHRKKKLEKEYQEYVKSKTL